MRLGFIYGLLIILIMNNVNAQITVFKRNPYNYSDNDIGGLKGVRKVVQKSSHNLTRTYLFNDSGKIIDMKSQNGFKLIDHFKFEYNDFWDACLVSNLYDINSNKNGRKIISSEFLYKYDSQNRINVEYEIHEIDTLVKTKYEYDSKGRVAKYIVDYDKIEGSSYIITLEYDAENKLNSECKLEMKESINLCYNYKYLDNKKVEINIVRNGNNEPNRVRKYKYDKHGNWVKNITIIDKADDFKERRKIKYK
jgi:hypothetical protein